MPSTGDSHAVHAGDDATTHTGAGVMAHGFRPGSVAGGVSGAAGLLAFLVTHHLWIVPIWSVVVFGGPFAVLGGAVVGWAYVSISDRLPRNLLLRWAIVTAGSVLLFVPTVTLVLLSTPYVTTVDGVPQLANVDASALAVRFVFDLFVVGAITGAAVGWLLLRTRQGALLFASAALIIGAGPGHNLPFFHFGTVPRETLVGTELFLITVAAASFALVVTDRLLESRARRNSEP